MKIYSLTTLLLLLSGCSSDGSDLGAPPLTSSGGGGIIATGGTPATGGTTSVSSGGTSGSGGFLATGGSATGGATSVGALLTEDQWNQFFPNRNALYTYQAFVTASQSFPGFGTTGDEVAEKQELAAFLANISHETTGGWETAPGGPYAWGLVFTEEVGCGGGACPGYAIGDEENVCVAGQSYHGRGPIQLSYCYNYGPAGRGIGVDLLAQPGLVSTDSVIAFKTGIWFWMHGKSGGTTSPHQAITGGMGFGATIEVINGIECNGSGTDSRVLDRIGFYQRITGILGVDPGSNLGC